MKYALLILLLVGCGREEKTVAVHTPGEIAKAYVCDKIPEPMKPPECL
jgi:hypothetical protein